MDPQITLTIDRSPPEFRPGETLAGKARWRGAEGATGMVLRLFWTTSGRGTSDIGVVAEQSLATHGPEGDQTFEFLLPAGPPSFSGQLITLSWGVELVIQPKGHAASAPFTLGRDGKEIRLPVVDAPGKKKAWWKGTGA